jgi:hypothetical protein
MLLVWNINYPVVGREQLGAVGVSIFPTKHVEPVGATIRISQPDDSDWMNLWEVFFGYY